MLFCKFGMYSEKQGMATNLDVMFLLFLVLFVSCVKSFIINMLMTYIEFYIVMPVLSDFGPFLRSEES